MSSKDWKPWYVRVGDISDPREREEFMRGIGGASKPTYGQNLLFALVAGYVGGKLAERTGKKK
jgi:hypothetical protein